MNVFCNRKEGVDVYNMILRKKGLSLEVVQLDDTTMEEKEPDRVSIDALTYTGSFSDVAHEGSGEASLIPLSDIEYALRLTDLDVLNGPDLRVLLSPNENVRGSGDLGEYIELGKLKGNKGNQNYEIPEGTDLTKFQSMVIYCKPFHVVFATAELQ